MYTFSLVLYVFVLVTRVDTQYSGRLNISFANNLFLP